MQPLVSIVVNCFNQGHYLERAVKSVLEQTFSNLECIIVDDGSTDHTRQVAESLIRRDSRVTYHHKENGGLPAARNFGITKAQGTWIQCLDADDWIHQDKTRFQLEHLKGIENQKIVFYCDYERVFINPDESIAETQPYIIGSLTSEQFIQRLLIPDFLVDSPHPALQQAMLMHRSIFDQGGRFPEQFKALGDRYFAIDRLVNGSTFVYTPLVGAFYTKHKTNRTNNWSYMRDYYISFYETVHQQHPDLSHLCGAGLECLINEAVEDQHQETINRLAKILRTSIDLHIWNRKIKVNSPALLKLLYAVRSRIPNFLLYEKYQGPRSKQILAMLPKF